MSEVFEALLKERGIGRRLEAAEFVDPITTERVVEILDQLLPQDRFPVAGGLWALPPRIADHPGRPRTPTLNDYGGREDPPSPEVIIVDSDSN